MTQIRPTKLYRLDFLHRDYPLRMNKVKHSIKLGVMG